MERREAFDEESLLRELAAKDIYLLSCRLEGEKALVRRPYSEKIVIEFTRTLCVLLQAGVSLENSLEVALGAFKTGRSRDLVTMLLEGVRKGASFSSLLDSLGSSFPPVYKGMVRIGERTGKLEPMFVRISSYMEEQKKLSDKIRGALMYPGLVLSIVALLILGIVFFLVPGLTGLFGHMGSGLPAGTARALNLMNIFAWCFLLLGLMAFFLIVAGRSIRARGGSAAAKFDKALLGLPLYGNYARLREALSFSFVMETLVAAGIGLEDALEESVCVLRNAAIKAAVLEVRADIMAGEALSSAFSRRDSLPPEFSRWAAIGERTGSVESIFAQTRSFFQYDLDRWTTRFMTLIEPSLIVAVGSILVAILLLFIVPFLTSFTAII
jgi:type II secretory pathway component PulF